MLWLLIVYPSQGLIASNTSGHYFRTSIGMVGIGWSVSVCISLSVCTQRVCTVIEILLVVSEESRNRNEVFECVSSVPLGHFWYRCFLFVSRAILVSVSRAEFCLVPRASIGVSTTGS